MTINRTELGQGADYRAGSAILAARIGAAVIECPLCRACRTESETDLPSLHGSQCPVRVGAALSGTAHYRRAVPNRKMCHCGAPFTDAHLTAVRVAGEAAERAAERSAERRSAPSAHRLA